LNDDTVFSVSKNELIELVKPLENAAYAAGKRDGTTEASNSVREATMEKAARVLSSGKQPASTSSSIAVDLARRAKEIQAAARKEGREMGDIESVKRAYEEAGVPLR
jgi:hypothetical protein